MKNRIISLMRQIVQNILSEAGYFFQSIFLQCDEVEKNVEEIYIPDVSYKKTMNYYNACTAFWGVERLERLPESISGKYGRVLKKNNRFPAGKTISFITDAAYIQLRVIYRSRPLFAHMSINAACGLDIYSNRGNQWEWISTFAPCNEVQMSMKRIVNIGKGDKKIVIYLPPYAQIRTVYLGFPQGISVKRIKPSKAPIVFYGSSITQGCAASRPGIIYCNIIARYCNRPILNFGFSESAKGQDEIIEYIAHTGADFFVIEYDHNVTTGELKDTHLRVYQMIRGNNKEAWIIFMSRFSGGYSISHKEEEERIAIIKNTVCYANNNSDERVMFLNGKGVFKNKELYLADDRHPNDAGMIRIARELIQKIESCCYEK